MTAAESEQAIVVLPQSEIDTAMYGLEQAGRGLSDEEFQDPYGDVYKKLHALDRVDESNCRVK
jgi:hypothetical protein